MNQQGYIIEIVDEKTAKLKMQRHSACTSCGKCQTLSSETKEILVEVDNTIGAKIGDHVEVNMDNMNVLKATALAYIVPLVFLMLGTIGSYFLLDKCNRSTRYRSGNNKWTNWDCNDVNFICNLKKK